MRQRPVVKFQPGLERCEAKLLLSASRSVTLAAHIEVKSTTSAGEPAHTSGTPRATSDLIGNNFRNPKSGAYGYLAFRVTQRPYKLIPPFQQVLVQHIQPVPGQTYNVLYLALKNGTSQ